LVQAHFHHYHGSEQAFEVHRTSTSWAQAARGNSSLLHIVNKHRITFTDDEPVKRYDAIVTRKILAPRYIDEQMLLTLHLLDDFYLLLGILG